jgi:hypothetical protein
MKKMLVRGMNAKVYTCCNASWESEDLEVYELKQSATCNFRIWGNSLLRWGKRSIGIQEVRKLLNKEEVSVRLFSKRAKKEYFKFLILDKEYGVSILWDD